MKAKKFTAAFFLSMIVIFMCLTPVSLVIKQVNKKAEAENEERILSIFKSSIDWEKLYPFDEYAYKHDEIPQNDSNKETLFSYVKRKIDDYSSKYFIGRLKAIEAAKTYEETLGWNIVSVYEYNGVTKLHDGYLTGINPKADPSSNAASVIDLADWCNNKDIDFLYINAPNKICASDDADVSGTLDFSNQNADKFLELLNEGGVRAYDLRKILHQDGIKHHEAFFITDHHWKPETGLWAAKHILEFLRNDYAWNIDPEILNPDKFEHVVYPEWFLGSQGKKFMLSRTKPDDFTMLYPKYDTMLHYEIPDRNIDLSGDFSVVYNMPSVSSKDYYHKNPYGAYNRGNHALTKIHSRLSSNDRRILVLHDSFGNCVVPFLALSIGHTEEIDLRSFNGSVRKYIEVNHPDAVAVMYYSAVTGGNSKMYDFR